MITLLKFNLTQNTVVDQVCGVKKENPHRPGAQNPMEVARKRRLSMGEPYAHPRIR